MAAVGALPLQYSSADYYYMANYGSRSESGSVSFTAPTTGDLHSDQQALPFDLSEYILMDEGSAPTGTNFMHGGGTSSTVPVIQGGISAPLMETGVFQAGPTSSSGACTSVTAASGAMERPRTERIAFRMISEVEIIDDGFKWRKYGKKSVKNSPNPRNYYRCSTEGCSVKKRVERDKDDASYVITTYEGVHNHVTPGAVYYTTQDAASGRYFVAGMQIPPGSS
ncbi:hypothetical protein LUZ60_000398 [Juncus effusus]|nr:hypothetical protein LUZ60_000398 [Juncus effusus]